jgi:PPOX class probable FMN-dependent enzyme
MSRVATLDELRAVYGQPSKLAAAAKVDRLDDLTRAFIAGSPFVMVGTSDAQGRQDVSPRGDAPGFVRVLDDRTLAIPDRPGNNKLENLSNIVATGRIALLFIIPGHDETVRVNGAAHLSTDADLLAAMAVEGKLPRAAIVVTAEEVYPHCAKAFRRSNLWHAAPPDKGSLPSLAQMAKMMAGDQRPLADLEAHVARDNKDGLY